MKEAVETCQPMACARKLTYLLVLLCLTLGTALGAISGAPAPEERVELLQTPKDSYTNVVVLSKSQTTLFIRHAGGLASIGLILLFPDRAWAIWAGSLGFGLFIASIFPTMPLSAVTVPSDRPWSARCPRRVFRPWSSISMPRPFASCKATGNQRSSSTRRKAQFVHGVVAEYQLRAVSVKSAGLKWVCFAHNTSNSSSTIARSA